MKTLKLILVVAAMFCFISSIAYAQGKEAKGPCRADIEKFCKDVKPGEGRIIECMKKHAEQLSPECKAKLKKDRPGHKPGNKSANEPGNEPANESDNEAGK
ncbi:MAG: cysteine rich repeat-containing protein [Smithella sp.]